MFTSREGYTGSGYLEGVKSITWNYKAKKAGLYYIDYHYGIRWGNNHKGNMVVNGLEYPINFYYTGSQGNYVWDRVVVKLTEGDNTIVMHPHNVSFIDKINIIPFMKTE